MGTDERLRKMRQLAHKLSDDLVREKYVVGVLLYGSVASGKIHERSDLDIATIYDASDDAYPLREEKIVEGFKADIWRYPITRFIHTFDDEQYREKASTWVKASIYVELMRSCQILKDPKRRLSEWRASAKNWKWRESEIEPVMKRVIESMRLLRRMVAKRDEFEVLLCLRDIVALLVCIHLMRHDMIPTWMPKDAWNTAIYPLKHAGHQELIDLFVSVNGLNKVDMESFMKLLEELAGMIKQESESKCTESSAHYEDAKACLTKGDAYGAVLSGRIAGQMLGHQILENRGFRLKHHWPDADVHLKMVEQCLVLAPFFHSFYKKLHDSNKYDIGALNSLAEKVGDAIKTLENSPQDHCKFMFR